MSLCVFQEEFNLGQTGLVFSFFFFNFKICLILGFPGGSVVKNPPASAGDMGLIPGMGRSLEKEMATQSSILA